MTDRSPIIIPKNNRVDLEDIEGYDIVMQQRVQLGEIKSDTIRDCRIHFEEVLGSKRHLLNELRANGNVVVEGHKRNDINSLKKFLGQQWPFPLLIEPNLLINTYTSPAANSQNRAIYVNPEDTLLATSPGPNCYFRVAKGGRLGICLWPDIAENGIEAQHITVDPDDNHPVVFLPEPEKRGDCIITFGDVEMPYPEYWEQARAGTLPKPALTPRAPGPASSPPPSPEIAADAYVDDLFPKPAKDDASAVTKVPVAPTQWPPEAPSSTVAAPPRPPSPFLDESGRPIAVERSPKPLSASELAGGSKPAQSIPPEKTESPQTWGPEKMEPDGTLKVKSGTGSQEKRIRVTGIKRAKTNKIVPKIIVESDNFVDIDHIENAYIRIESGCDHNIDTETVKGCLIQFDNLIGKGRKELVKKLKANGNHIIETGFPDVAYLAQIVMKEVWPFPEFEEDGTIYTIEDKVDSNNSDSESPVRVSEETMTLFSNVGSGATFSVAKGGVIGIVDADQEGARIEVVIERETRSRAVYIGGVGQGKNCSVHLKGIRSMPYKEYCKKAGTWALFEEPAPANESSPPPASIAKPEKNDTIDPLISPEPSISDEEIEEELGGEGQEVDL